MFVFVYYCCLVLFLFCKLKKKYVIILIIVLLISQKNKKVFSFPNLFSLNGETKGELDTVPFYSVLYHGRNRDDVI